MSSEHIANQLVGGVARAILRQFLPIEHFQEISISKKRFCPGTLKIAFCKLCFNQQIPNSHVNFRAIKSTVCERNAGSVSKNRSAITVGVQERQHPTVP